jgi:hypothetical protein
MLGRDRELGGAGVVYADRQDRRRAHQPYARGHQYLLRKQREEEMPKKARSSPGGHGVFLFRYCVTQLHLEIL